MGWPTLGSTTAKEQNRTLFTRAILSAAGLIGRIRMLCMRRCLLTIYPAKTSITTSKNALAIFAKYPPYLRITRRLKSAYVTDSWLFEKLKPRSRNLAGKLCGKWQRDKRCCLKFTFNIVVPYDQRRCDFQHATLC